MSETLGSDVNHEISNLSEPAPGVHSESENLHVHNDTSNTLDTNYNNTNNITNNYNYYSRDAPAPALSEYRGKTPDLPMYRQNCRHLNRCQRKTYRFTHPAQRKFFKNSEINKLKDFAATDKAEHAGI